MSNLPTIRHLVAELQILAKEEWGRDNYDCDCSHDETLCKCGCEMCISGWNLTEMNELHNWERKLIPIVTSRNPLKEN